MGKLEKAVTNHEPGKFKVNAFKVREQLVEEEKERLLLNLEKNKEDKLPTLLNKNFSEVYAKEFENDSVGIQIKKPIQERKEKFLFGSNILNFS